MPLTVTQIRQREDAVDAAYVLFIDGIEYAFATGHTGEGLLGSGSGSWIYDAEVALGEPTGRRQVLPGLKLPKSMALEDLDTNNGLLSAQSITIKLVDFDGVVATLFAQEGKSYEILGEDIPPGTAALGAAVVVQQNTTNPRGRHIGVERIGPSGERVDFSCFPFSRIGPRHSALGWIMEDGPPPVRISDAPIDFAGRTCALYRIYRDPIDGSWPHWVDQYSGGGLVWRGKLLDTGEISGAREWSLKCAGPESFLKRTLNVNTPKEWMTVLPETTLTELERYISVEFRTIDHVDAYADANLASSRYSNNPLLSASLTRETAISEISAIVQDVVVGNVYDVLTTFFTDAGDGNAVVSANAEFRIRINATYEAGYTEAVMAISMHEKVWRLLGYDPPLQYVDAFSELSDDTQIEFRQLGVGELHDPFDVASPAAPTNDYWIAFFSTSSIGRDSFGNPSPHNDSSWRNYAPLYYGTTQLLTGSGNQIFGMGFDPFVEASPPTPFSSTQINGSSVDSARFFVFKGKIATGVLTEGGQLLDEDGELVAAADIEGKDLLQVGKVSWVSNGYGQATAVDGMQSFNLERWASPRLFGLPHSPLKGEWLGLADPSNDDYRIKCLPLASYIYHDADTPADYQVGGTAYDLAPDVFCQLLLSTGTAGGWSGAFDASPTFARGDNLVTPGASYWSHDVQTSDLGLAIPYQLVASPDDIAEEFAKMPEGLMDVMNRVRYSFIGPFESLELIEQLLRPRALAMSMRGNQYGVMRLGIFPHADADVDIGEGDLDDPFGDKVRQTLRAMDQVDKVVIDSTWNCVEEEFNHHHDFRAKDNNSRWRFGELQIEMKDGGLALNKGWMISFRELWSVQMAEFYSRRHFEVTNLRVSRIKGQDLHVGTRIRLTNPWLVNAEGTYGVSSHRGIITSVKLATEEHVYIVSALIFADQNAARLWAPIGQISGITGANVTLSEVAPYASASDFAEKSYSSGGAVEVVIASWDGYQWDVSASYTVDSVAGATVTLTTSPGLAIRDRDKFLLLAPVASQSGTSWAEDIISVVTLGDRTYDGGTAGAPLLP